MDTFAYLPELYKVGYDELLRALWPEYEKREDRATKLFGAMPWLAVLVEQLAVASPEVQRIITKVLDVEREQIPA